jgi:hypothetical protein
VFWDSLIFDKIDIDNNFYEKISLKEWKLMFIKPWKNSFTLKRLFNMKKKPFPYLEIEKDWYEDLYIIDLQELHKFLQEK